MSSDSTFERTVNGGQSSDEGSRTQIADSAALREANELLETLEHTHRNDLALHLYSTHLLKSVLKAANRKNFALETNTFIKTQIKDNWTSWPNPSTVIDPQIDTIFEDGTDLISTGSSSLEPGEISPAGLEHASIMVKAELNAVWHNILAAKASRCGLTLDIDKMDIPTDISTAIMNKMDHFFKGLHTTVASTNKIKLSQTSGSSRLTISESRLGSTPVRMNRKIKLDHRDILTRGCKMGDDMYEIYMKTLELYSDIPMKYRKREFKLSKKELTKYTAKTRREHKKPISYSMQDNGYISAEKLLKQNTLSFEDRIKLRSILHKDRDRLIDKKTFLWIKGCSQESNEDTLEKDAYATDDWIVPLRRTHSKSNRKDFLKHKI
ncbi:LANO_0F13828g1_1 [Lachancea nothofagi CBS 11611]|uniref:LANO_0F13828g1_1 n=1 Tax=Lachancea nothofagi CBS 11611 TaxID=1266666 RepID=A0A1G4KBW0_9SACH|nr:LANO_0F13828g1_1 [Lachancea nothofagi CBS 11611]